ncbi:hypothetical protein ZOSMA_271G00110 [Zostera marina]|uniref:Uncharacterized protein n=1 Tax=Zostera marina TaxID=29655 RepID=A0A0K9PDS9_ZOSMR|nr:hypothetical protein ZOSMA_271G00110 [Zostera marina]
MLQIVVDEIESVFPFESMGSKLLITPTIPCNKNTHTLKE